MRFRGQTDDQVDVRLSIDELVLVRKVLHEVCENMHFSENDFQAIFGVPRGEMEGLLRRADSLLDRLEVVLE